MSCWSGEYRPATLSRMNLTASSSETATLQVCAWGRIQQDSSFHTSLPEDTSFVVNTGLQVWFAISVSEVAQYSFVNGDSNWTFDRTWSNVNGRAGMACQSWPADPDSYMTCDTNDNTTSYLFFSDLSGTIIGYWKDVANDTRSTISHPIIEWSKSSSPCSDS